MKMIGDGNFVLLAAGRGSRLSELTATQHKSMLPIADKPAIEHIIDAILAKNPAQVVVVVGHRAEELTAFIHGRYGHQITCVENKDYEKDTNILSTDIGVDALSHPENGYLIVETDLVLSAGAWEVVLSHDAQASFWVTKDRYSETLTGGTLFADENNHVTDLVYAPKYDAQYAGWKKLIGLLYVAPQQVAADRSIRKYAITQSIGQYYMTPWVDQLSDLPCDVLDLGESFAATYNDLGAYRRAESASAQLL